jgi:hypothetical protein
VIGFPYRPNSLIADPARSGFIILGCKKFDDTGAKIGPTQQQIQQKRYP